MPADDWKEKAACLGDDVGLFFETYEEELDVRTDTDQICASCPVARICFATGISQKAWGVWGGIYLENGKISKEFNKHRNKEDWNTVWQYLTINKE